MRFNLKIVGFMSIMFLMFIGLTACGGSDSKNGEVTLELWHTWTEDRPENTIYKDKVEEFNEEHSDIEIELEGVPNDDIETKLRTQAAADELPDMFKGYPGARMENFVESDQVMSIDSIMDNWEGTIPDEMLEGFNFDGEQYAVPGNISITSLVYYNKDMIEEEGYDEFPDNYEDFKELIRDLNDSDTTPISFGNKAQWPLQSSYMSAIGDRFTGSDFIEDALDGDEKFTDQRFVDALSVIEELAKLDTFNENFNTIDESQARSDFIQEESAMHIAGSWSLGPILEEATEPDDIGVAPFPDFEGEEGESSKVSGVIGNGIYLSNDLDDKKQEAAEEFLKFFYDDELYEDLAKEADLLVPVDVDEDEVTEFYTNVNSLSDNGLAPVYDATLNPELTDEINKGLQSMTTESLTPEELAEKMQEINEKE